MKLNFIQLTIAVSISITISATTLYAGNQVNLDAYVPGCLDGIITAPEECDGIDLNNQTCETLGFYGGFLSCKNDCSYDTSMCFTDPNTTSKGYLSSGFKSPKSLLPQSLRPSFIDNCLQTESFQEYLNCIFLVPVKLETLKKSSLKISPNKEIERRDSRLIDQEDIKSIEEQDNNQAKSRNYIGEADFVFFAQEATFPLVTVIIVIYSLIYLGIVKKIGKNRFFKRK